MKVFVFCTHWAYNSLIKRRFLGMTNKIIGDNIRRILAENKKTGKVGVPRTQVELATALGTTKQQVGAYVNGRYVIN